MSTSRPMPAGRFDALDTLRCLAVLVMVQGHSFFVTLHEQARSESWYSWHNYLHGYTAPAFLFGAGLAFGYTTLTERIGSHASWGPVLRKRLYRYLSLFAIGYAIQLPPLAVATSQWSFESVQTFLRVEALQHIGTALLCAQLLVVILRRPWLVAFSALGLGVAIVVAGPAMSRLPISIWGSPALAAYMSLDSGSTFPLVPWAGFVMVGVFVGALVYRARRLLTAAALAWVLLAGGLALVGLSLGLDRLAPDAFGAHFYWKVSPYFFLRRLGWVVVMLGAFAVLDCYLPQRTGEVSKTRRWIRLISQHSLVAYVGHLVLLYGSPLSPGLRVVTTGKLGLLGSSFVVAGLLVALAALLALWESWEDRFEARFSQFRRVGLAVMASASLVAAVRIAVGPAIFGGQPAVVASASDDDAPVSEDGPAAEKSVVHAAAPSTPESSLTSTTSPAFTALQ